MKWFNNMKIGPKLIASFLIVALLTGIVGLIGIFNVSNSDSQHTYLFTNYGDSQGDLGFVYSSFLQMRISLRDLMLDHDAKNDAAYHATIKTSEDDLTKYMAEFKKTCDQPEEMQRYNDISSYIDSFYVERDKMLALCTAGKDVEAYALLQSQEVSEIDMKADKAITDAIDGNISTGGMQTQNLDNSMNRSIVMLIILVGAAFIIAIMLGIFVSSSLSKRIQKLVHGADRVARGEKDVKLDITGKDEVGMLASAFARVIDSIDKLITDVNLLTADAAAGKLDVRGDSSKYEGEYSELIRGINSIIDAMATPINDAVSQMDIMARNDFTGGMNDGYNGAFAELSQSFNSVIETMNQMLSDISASAEQVAAGTQQVSAGSQALSHGATEQASAIEELTASVTDIASQTKQNAVNANQANELAISAKEEAEDGNTRMKDLQRAMNEINEASANISKIIKVIDEIAFQTNLLALNAAVEAARAGQHGKGFAVVAEEVRNLAQRSAGAAKETTEMIEESIKKVKAGTKMADETAQALNKIVTGIEKATSLVGGIATASNDQATAVAQVNSGIEQVSQVVQTNSATAEESAAASEELSSQAVLLKEMVGKFSLKGQVFSAKPSGSSKAVQALSEGKPSAPKPKIVLNDREFGKY